MLAIGKMAQAQIDPCRGLAQLLSLRLVSNTKAGRHQAVRSLLGVTSVLQRLQQESF